MKTRRGRCALGIVVGVLLVAASFGSTAGAGTVAPDVEVTRRIVFPVSGTASFSDTFGACRSGCTRGHEGTDVFAATLTPLVAVRDGRVRRAVGDWVVGDGSAGNAVFLSDDDGWQYWYLHLNNDSPGTDDGANPPGLVLAPGIESGSRVQAGQLIGYLGDSGNAEATAPHLHFEIHNPDREVVNPYRSLVAAPRLTAPLGVDPTVVTADEAFLDALNTDFLAGARDDVDRAVELAAIEAGRSVESFVTAYASSDAWVQAMVDGYYRSTLGRVGERTGLAFWADTIRAGRSPARVAADFYASDEYHGRVGGTDAAWITDLYTQLLGWAPDPAGLGYWLEQLATGMPPSEIAYALFQSPEHRGARVTDLYERLLGRSPDAAGLEHWTAILASGEDVTLAMHLASSDEYRTRATSRRGEDPALEEDTASRDWWDGHRDDRWHDG